jgi:hypothetical protein
VAKFAKDGTVVINFEKALRMPKRIKEALNVEDESRGRRLAVFDFSTALAAKVVSIKNSLNEPLGTESSAHTVQVVENYFEEV